jgi:hypothetical protein
VDEGIHRQVLQQKQVLLSMEALGGRMMPSKRILVLLCVLALFALVFGVAACGGDEETTTSAAPETTAPASSDTTATTAPASSDTTAAPSGEAKTLKIGTIMPLSGPLSVVALAFTRGWELYADDVNNAGGVKIGNDTYTIELIHEDSKAAANDTNTAASKLVTQGVNVYFTRCSDRTDPRIHAWPLRSQTPGNRHDSGR